jgi:hypothetical protein
MAARKVKWKLDLDNTDEESSSSITVIRNSLKSQLMVDRGELTTAGWLPICPICNEPVRMPDMHEVIITRGDVQGSSVVHQLKIFVRENCVLVHPGKCILHLVEKEGLIVILQYLAEMEGVLPRELLNEAINLVQHVNQNSTIQACTTVRPKIPIIGIFC